MAHQYNLALIFGRDVHEPLLEVARSIAEKNELTFSYDENSVPHVSVLKFEVDEELTDAEKDTLIGLWSDVEVQFSGIRVLPSRTSNEEPGVWVEVPIVDTVYLIGLVEAAISALDVEMRVLNEIGREFRPHITLGKTASYDAVVLPELDPELFRKSGVPADVAIGGIGEGFAFREDS